MAQLTLEVVEGPDAGVQVSLRDPLQIGRDPGAGLQLNDGQVSRSHARVTPRNGDVVVEDLGSSNGTFVNQNEIVGPTIVAVGDELLIGVSVLEVRSAVQVNARPSAVRAVPVALAAEEREPSFVPSDRQTGASSVPELERLRDERVKHRARLAPLAVFLIAALIVVLYLGLS
jgi:pSer/pThr/pTyr-binding forkhead associated (FHA) protein